MKTHSLRATQPSSLRTMIAGFPCKIQGLGMLMLLLAACSNAPTQTPPPAAADTGVPLRAAPEPASAPALVRNSGEAGTLHHRLDYSLGVRAVTPDGRLAFLSPSPGRLEAAIWDFSAGAVVARPWVGLKPVLDVGADEHRWILLRATGELEFISLLSGVRKALPDAPCHARHVATSSSGGLVVFAESCAARWGGTSWESLPNLEGRQVLTAAVSAEGHLALAGAGPGDKFWIQRDRAEQPQVVATPGTSHIRSGVDAPSADAPSRPLVEVPRATLETQSVSLQWGADGTLYLVGEGATLYRWASGADAVPQALALELPLRSPQVLADLQQVLGLNQAGELVRLSLADGKLLERADLAVPQVAVSSLRLRLAGDAQSLLIDGKEEGLEPSRISPFQVELQSWRRKTLPPPAHALMPCAATWLTPTSFAVLATQDSKGKLETLLAVVSATSTGGDQGVEWLSVSTEPLPPASNALTSHCVLTPAPDGKTLALFTGDSLKIYDLEARQRTGRRKVADVLGLAFAADAESLYIMRREGQVERAEVPGLDEPVVLTRYQRGLESVDSTAGSDLLTLVSKGETGHRLEVFSAERLRVLGGVNVPNRPTSVATDISHLLSVITYAGSGPQLWSVPSSRVGTSALPESDTAHFSPDGRWLLMSRESVSIRSAQGGLRSGYKEVGSMVLPALSEWMALSPSGGRCILVRDRSGRISLIESAGASKTPYSTLKKRFELWLLPDKQHLALSPSGGWTGSPTAQNLLIESTVRSESGAAFAPSPPSPRLLQDLMRACAP